MHPCYGPPASGVQTSCRSGQPASQAGGHWARRCASPCHGHAGQGGSGPAAPTQARMETVHAGQPGPASTRAGGPGAGAAGAWARGRPGGAAPGPTAHSIHSSSAGAGVVQAHPPRPHVSTADRGRARGGQPQRGRRRHRLHGPRSKQPAATHHPQVSRGNPRGHPQHADAPTSC